MQSKEIEDLKKRKLELKKEKLYNKYRNVYWALYHHLSTKNQRMTFENRKFLVDIYKDMAEMQKMCIMKSVQCGISEGFIVTHLEQAEKGMSVLYILPKTDLRNRFVNNRVNTVLAKVGIYREILSRSLSRADSVSLKIFGDGSINYVASNSPANFTEYPADVVYARG